MSNLNPHKKRHIAIICYVISFLILMFFIFSHNLYYLYPVLLLTVIAVMLLKKPKRSRKTKNRHY